MNIIENIVTKAYHQEMSSFVPVLQKLQMRKKPRVFLMYIQYMSKELVIDEVELRVIKGFEGSIVRFGNSK